MAEACRARRGQPRPRARARARRGLAARAATRSASTRTPAASASGSSSCSPSRPARRARASSRRRASRRTAPTGRRTRCALADPYELGAGVLPLGVRDRGRRLDPRDQPVRPAGRAGGEGQDERGARVGRRAATSSRRARSTSCFAQAQRRRLRLRSRRSSTRRASEARLEPLVDRARAATGCVVTHGLGPRYLHSTGPAAQGRPARPGSSSRSSTTPATSSPIPGSTFGFGRLIRAQAAGDFASLQERGRRVARIRLEDVASAARNGRPRPHGRRT